MADSIGFHRPIRFSVRNANVNQYVIDTYDSVTPKTRLRFKGNDHLQFVSIVIRWKKTPRHRKSPTTLLFLRQLYETNKK